MYVAGWNQPGYLPESDPEEFDTFEDARDYISEELWHQGEVSADEQADLPTEGWKEAVDLANRKTGPFSIIGPDKYIYWVMEE